MQRLLAALPVAFLLACASAPETVPPTAEGLVRASSWQLDELYVRPNADLPAYTKVLLDPVPVALRADWATQRNAYDYRIQPAYPMYTDAERVREDMASLMRANLADAFRAAGYETVALAGPGVLRVSAKVNELFINAPERMVPAYTRSAARDAGQAKLSLEAYDSATGMLLARIEHFGLAREALRANPADDVSNRMWFDVLFSRFSSNCVAAFGNARRTAVSLAD